MTMRRSRARSGTTLIELLLALVGSGIMLAMAVLGVVRLRDALHVRHAARLLADAFGTARSTALAQHGVMQLVVTPQSLTIRRSRDLADVQRTPLPPLDAVDGAPRLHRFAPDGLMLDVGNATYVLRRGSTTRRVIVAKYGRTRIE